MVNKKPLALYVHWPFCKAKCPYCDFNSHVRASVDHEKWRANLLRELDFYGDKVERRPLESIFFGGGTPSLMEPATVAAIIDSAQMMFGFANDIEITLEANPTSVEADKFKAFRAAGVNRVSLGVQALNDTDLKALGREHSVAEALKAVDLAASIFDRHSFDLIYARQGQSPDAWVKELEQALSLAGDHLSLYQLTIEPGTQFHTLYHTGRLHLPSDEASTRMYEITQEMAGAAGMPAYEVSNHARAGQESRHNLVYWRYGEYIGIGPGAHGRIVVAGQRMATRAHRAPEEWLARVDAHGHGSHGHGGHEFEAIDARQQFEERLMMGLRLSEGVAMDTLNHEWLDLPRIESLRKAGLLTGDTARLAATPEGRMVLTSLNGALVR